MYLLNCIHLTLYVVVLCTAYYVAYVYRFPWCLGASPFLGWSLYALVTVGHDAMHQNFTPYPKLNKCLAFLCLDCILVPKEAWQEEHSLHHFNPGAPEDHMILDGGNFFLEMKNLLLTPRKITFCGELPKIPLVVAMFLLPVYCVPIIWLTTIICFAYLALATHIVEPNLREWKDEDKTPENIALNIFPHSHAWCFLAGALNIHGPHHKNPRWTRQELMDEAKKEGYKEINSWGEYWSLLKNRT